MLAATSGPQGSAGVSSSACSPGSVEATDAISHSAAPSALLTLPLPRSLAPELAAATSGPQGSAGVPPPAHRLDYLRSASGSPGSADSADATSRSAALSEVRTAPEHMTPDPLQHVAPPTTVEGQSAEPSEIENETVPPTGNVPPTEIDQSPAPSSPSPALSPEPELPVPS